MFYWRVKWIGLGGIQQAEGDNSRRKGEVDNEDEDEGEEGEDEEEEGEDEEEEGEDEEEEGDDEEEEGEGEEEEVEDEDEEDNDDEEDEDDEDDADDKDEEREQAQLNASVSDGEESPSRGHFFLKKKSKQAIDSGWVARYRWVVITTTHKAVFCPSGKAGRR